jgi:DNA-binding transcriptional MocR family regulator
MLDLFAAQPTMQLVRKPGVVDLTWGHPDPRLLDVAALQTAAAEAFARDGSDLLGYGNERGPAALRGWLARRMDEREGRAPTPDEIMITGGNSLAIDQVCTLLARPGDIVFVENPTYHLAVRILRDHPLELRPVPVDADGMRVDLLAEELAGLRRAGRQARMIYTVPTFHNPTGASLRLDRRQELIAVAAQHGALIIEDDVYRELAYDGAAPPSLWSMAPAGVLRLGSFAKSVAPGLRLGWMTGPAELIERIAGGGLLDSGGGINHFTAMIMAHFCTVGSFDAQLERLRAAYRERRDALTAALAEALPADVTVQFPGGGFFVWVELPEGGDAGELLARAEAQGVSYLPGGKFSIDGGGARALRLAYSLYEPDELRAGARSLGRAYRQYMGETS